GLVGIGTTSPVFALEIGTTTSTTAFGGLYFGGDMGTDLYRSGSATLKTDAAMVINGTTIIGGTTFAGSSQLSVNSTSNANEHAFTVEANSSADWVFVGKNDQNNDQVDFGGGGSTQASFDVRSGGTIGTFLVSHAGNVGIGTSTPYLRLNVASTTQPQLALEGNDNENIWTLRSIGNYLYFATSSPSTYATSTQSALVIDSNGNVGIGTSTPGSKFALSGIANFTTATSSFYGNGINLANGCFSIGGTCVGGSAGAGITSITLGDSLFGTSPITTTGTIYGAVGTSSTPTLGNLAFWNSAGDATHGAHLGTVATTTISNGNGISLSANPGALVGGSNLTVTCATANTSTFGCLLANDWNKFNSATTTFSTGLTYTNSTNAVTVNTSQSINTLSNLTTNGFIYTANGTGALNVVASSSPFT